MDVPATRLTICFSYLGKQAIPKLLVIEREPNFIVAWTTNHTVQTRKHAVNKVTQLGSTLMQVHPPQSTQNSQFSFKCFGVYQSLVLPTLLVCLKQLKIISNWEQNELRPICRETSQLCAPTGMTTAYQLDLLCVSVPFTAQFRKPSGRWDWLFAW